MLLSGWTLAQSTDHSSVTSELKCYDQAHQSLCCYIYLHLQQMGRARTSIYIHLDQLLDLLYWNQASGVAFVFKIC